MFIRRSRQRAGSKSWSTAAGCPCRPAAAQCPQCPRQTEFEGRLGRIPGPGRQLGEAQPPEANRWPALVTYLTIETAEASLQAELYPWVLLLEKNQPSGFDGRDWRPVYMTAQKHRGYAAQWLALALASLVYWLLAGFRRGKGGFQ
jgi:cytochrome oxidase assembly protein ShyY1